LTEDNEINQQIAIELLEGAGASVRVANNGREAVETLLNGPQPPPFDVVLMDLQMPELDGYQATAKLRSEARFSGLPIIAMTAHATVEERERCLAAGMNDHVSKPIDPLNLFETVARFYKPAAASRDSDGMPAIAGLDTEDGLSRVGGNRKLYLKLLGQFVDQQGRSVEQVTDALAAGDTPLAERLAHTLKGVAGNIGAKRVQSAAGVLENAIRQQAAPGDVDSARHDVAAVLAPLVTELRVVLGSTPSAPSAPSPQVQSNPAMSREAGARLAALLSDFDPAAADFVEANQNLLRPLFATSAWPEFESLVQNYAFADAQAQLERALKGASV
jgi:two-component system sensor histidine kinase/response regulator